MKRQFFLFILLSFSLLSYSQEIQKLKYQNSVGLTFDNDFYFKTDKYYSAGESLLFISPVIARSPFSRLLIKPLDSGNRITYGLRLSHKIFTPSRPSEAGLKIGDRPFSASLYLTHFSILENKELNYRLESSLKLGVFGKHAFGGQLQSFIHEITPSAQPLGWEYQLKSDFYLNYGFAYTGAFYSSEYFELLASSFVNLGTINSDIAISPTIRIGRMNNYFNSFSVSDKSRVNLWAEASYLAKVVAYNAYLQGGIFNGNNIYEIPSSEIERLNHQLRIKLYLEYYRHRLIFSRNIISPEFSNASWHRWIGFEYQFWF